MNNLKPHTDEELTNLLNTLYSKYHYDFRNYSRVPLERRIGLALESLDCQTIVHLQEKNIQQPVFLPELIQCLTIGVSDMFRHPTYFLYFREKIVPYIRSLPTIKIWVAGCSTGEEAYSLAIILQEEGLLDKSIIYATDINITSLKQDRNHVSSLTLALHFQTWPVKYLHHLVLVMH